MSEQVMSLPAALVRVLATKLRDQSIQQWRHAETAERHAVLAKEISDLLDKLSIAVAAERPLNVSALSEIAFNDDISTSPATRDELRQMLAEGDSAA